MKSIVIFSFGFIVGATVLYFFIGFEQTPLPIQMTNSENGNLNSENKMIRVQINEDLKTESLREPKIADRAESSVLGSELTTDESVSLPTQEQLSKYKGDFRTSIEKFHVESIDYDWADQSEFGFYEQFELLPDEVQDSFLSFQCRSEHCVLELNDADFHNHWGSVIGKLISYNGKTFGNVHFEPYPSPNSKQDYVIVMERFFNTEKSD